MKTVKSLLKIVILLSLSISAINASSSANGILRTSQEVVLTPVDGHSLSIKRISGDGSNFDITMSNNGSIYYSADKQVDDIYVVFHDDVKLGDQIKIHVNNGSFRYKIAPLKALPKLVKKALYKKAIKKKSKKITKKSITKKNIVKKKRVLKKEVVKKSIKRVEKKLEVKPIVKEIKVETKKSSSKMVKKETRINNDKNNNVLNDTFFNNFTNIFKDLVKTFSIKPSVSSNKQASKTLPKVNNKKIIDNNQKQVSIKKDTKSKKKKIVQKSKLPLQDKGIMEAFDDRALIHEATVIRSDFSKLPTEIEIFDDKDLIKSAKVKKRTFKTIKKEAKIKKDVKPKTEPKSTSITNPIEDKKSIAIPKQTKTKQLPTNNNITATKPSADMKQKRVILQEDRIVTTSPNIGKSATKTPSYDNEKIGSYPDTGYKKGYEDITKYSVKKETKSKVELVDNSNENKIVITKIIDKQIKEQNDDPFAGRVLGRIDDRVLGGGYNPNAGSSKFGMKVTKNSQPVSAWIEVFKDGTKDRVKTFYTRNSNRVKKIKLPAGVYMIRATYRTRDGKVQKTIKNIKLKKGTDITKHIAFYDGKLKVIARRADRSLYVRVTAYKSGTKEKVGFEFSDRHSGIAYLTLMTGTYDIVVSEHNKQREFNNIKITSGKTYTINADF